MPALFSTFLSVVALSEGCSVMLGKYFVLTCLSLMEPATSFSMDKRVTSYVLFRQSTLAMAVDVAPLPTKTMLNFSFIARSMDC